MDRPVPFILYIGQRAGQLEFPQGEWEVAVCQGPEDIPDVTRRPDIFLMDPFAGPSEGGCDMPLAREWLGTVSALPHKYPPAVFAVLPAHCGVEERVALMAAGFDDAVEWPVSHHLLRHLSRCHTEKNRIAQDLDAKQEALDRSFAYLDRFKGELKKTKTELGEERNSLNAALKQVQQMTLERRRLKAGETDLKRLLKENMEGFGNILHTLIQHRVEENRGHGERVANIAEFIAKGMGMGEKKLEDLRKAAMLHEIGLLFLTGLSRGPFGEQGQDDDFNMAADSPEGPPAYDQALRVQYPVKGAQLLKQCPGFEGPGRIIHNLNENADGTGFPDGLRRRYIPLASKILAGADELENLREKAEIKGVDDILKALEGLAGVRLDPVIVGWLEKYVVIHLGPEAFKVRGAGIEHLEPGMELATALFTASGTKLFTANTVLTRESIDKIIQYHREYPVDATVYIKV
ncbi:MAG: hypothetical protein HUN04_04235 [Desulfobacter sp.]|nr:MAG: hypothetical protein HUN04_04235 [Desulfobacter sp.]